MHVGILLYLNVLLPSNSYVSVIQSLPHFNPLSTDEHTQTKTERASKAPLMSCFIHTTHGLGDGEIMHGCIGKLLKQLLGVHLLLISTRCLKVGAS